MYQDIESNIKLKDGNEMPALGLGTWLLTGETCVRAVKKALELGYRHIDTAEAYENQKEIGKAIKGSGLDRSQLFLTSKVWRTNLHHDDVIKACDKTLGELGTDHLDLYLIHWPNSSIPMEETFEAFARLIKSGKVKSIGVSNFTINHLKDAFKSSKKFDVPITVNQVEFHPRLYQKELLEFCKKSGMTVTAYSPLGRGSTLKNEVIKEVAKDYGKAPAQVCLRWLLQRGVVVIPKASSEEHLKENMDIFDWTMKEEDVRRIDALGVSERFINPSFNEFEY